MIMIMKCLLFLQFLFFCVFNLNSVILHNSMNNSSSSLDCQVSFFRQVQLKASFFRFLGPPAGIASLPDLPTVPSSSPPPPSVGGQSMKGDDVDFDDLSRRFEELKKKK